MTQSDNLFNIATNSTITIHYEINPTKPKHSSIS